MSPGDVRDRHVRLAVPAARPDHPRALRVGRRDERDRLILEGTVPTDEVLRVAPFPPMPVDHDRRAVEVDAPEEFGAGRFRTGRAHAMTIAIACEIRGIVS